MAPRPNKKLLYIILFAIVLLAIPGLYLGFLYVKDLRSNASTEIPPKSIQVFNRVDNSVDIAWMTDEPAQGTVTYNNNTLKAEDIRGGSYKGYSHIVKLRGLDPKTTYSYKIVSNDRTYGENSITTFGAVLTEPKSFAGTAKNGDQSSMGDNCHKSHSDREGKR
jgi:hypothetical protein